VFRERDVARESQPRRLGTDRSKHLVDGSQESHALHQSETPAFNPGRTAATEQRREGHDRRGGECGECRKRLRRLEILHPEVGLPERTLVLSFPTPAASVRLPLLVLAPLGCHVARCGLVPGRYETIQLREQRVNLIELRELFHHRRDPTTLLGRHGRHQGLFGFFPVTVSRCGVLLLLVLACAFFVPVVVHGREELGGVACLFPELG